MHTAERHERRLEKGRKAAAVGTQKESGGIIWEKAANGKWKYVRLAAPKGKSRQKSAVQPTAPVQPVQQTHTQYKDLWTPTKAEVDRIRKKHERSDRMSYGQPVSYHGSFWRGYSGKQGKIVAIGDHGYAVVDFGNKDLKTAEWKDIKPVGSIKPHSLYDGLDEKNVYRVGGDLRKRIDAAMNQKIGASKWSYKDLAEHFDKYGFALHLVGGTLRDILQGKQSLDMDFIFNGTDRELRFIVSKLNPAWVNTAKTNKHLGLCSFTDAGVTVDITPVHKFSHEMNDLAKGWTLKEDAVSRDLVLNTLQYEPIENVMVDATGRALEDIHNNEIAFNMPDKLYEMPRYLLRAFKFLARGYNMDSDTEKSLMDNLQHISRESPRRIVSFFKNQIAMKDGKHGMEEFRKLFKKYDHKGVWSAVLEKHFLDVWRTL